MTEQTKKTTPSSHAEIVELQLRDPFGIARGTRRSVKNLLINVDGGWGEGAPVYYHGQNAEEMLDLANDWLENADWQSGDIDALLDNAEARYPDQSALIQAIDLALHDRAAKRAGVPLSAFLGVERSRPLRSSFTIGIDEPDVMMQKVERAKPYPILKIKVGTENDLAVLEKIWQHSKKEIYVDANEGWSVPQTIEFLPQLQKLGVRMVEQPLHRDDVEGYQKLKRDNPTAIPIMIDEGIQNPADVQRWAGIVDGVNLKLAKCGGIRRGLEIIRKARSLEMKVMLGCMIESSVGVTAAAHIAPLVDFIDLDGAELTANDPFDGMDFNHGNLTLPDRTGIGVVRRGDN